MKQSDPTVEPRVPLNRERVFRAAVVLADERGIESLTMRALGEELGVEAMSLYYYVANKDELLDGIVDLVYAEIELPSGGADWKTAIRRVATSAHEALSRHRWAITLMETRTRPGPANLRHHDSVIRTFREAGFSIKQAIHAFSVLDSYISGFALQQLTLPFDTSEELVQAAESILAQFPADEYPHLAETISEHVTKSGYDYADEFEVGLDLILGGIERLRDTA
ncbi:MAG TPA: TetR/AcrR family transcriptional regulator [Gaiellaceae bacterium]|nr:TetR/AcrR family transcriptional regulator [Gaiellaceae bacterium]